MSKDKLTPAKEYEISKCSHTEAQNVKDFPMYLVTFLKVRLDLPICEFMKLQTSNGLKKFIRVNS